MLNRHEVIMVMYDLPVANASERKRATTFRKTLIQMGYINLQKSIYVKLLRSHTNVAYELGVLRDAAPCGGTVNAIPMSLKDFRMLETISGDQFDMAIFSDDIVVV